MSSKPKIIKTPRGKFRLGGRIAPKHPHRPIRLCHLMRAPIALPPSTNRRAKADGALRDIDLNDTLGICVIAGRAHRVALLTGYATGKPFQYTKAQLLAEYRRVGGYDGTPATDNGCDMASAANDALTFGYADGSKDVGWIAIDPSNPTELKTAIYLFEVLDIGTSLPDDWVDPFPQTDNFVWDVAGAPDPSNGHCYQAIDYDTNGILVDTWGLYGYQTFPAFKKYNVDSAGGEVLVHLNQDQLDKAMQRSPDGVAWGDLIAAFNSMGGNIPVPAPSPDPGPAPTPPPVPVPPTPAPPSQGVTLAQAQNWAGLGVKDVKNLSSTMRSHITSSVSKTLAKYWPT